MKSILKKNTLEDKFPIMAVEHGCIVSKEADVTVAFRVELPELFSVTTKEYEAIHATWLKAIKVLPDYSVVHKQDRFLSQKYRPENRDGDQSFLSRSFERHFNERPYLEHACYLFLTKTTKERISQQSNFTTLCRGFIIPKEIRDPEAISRFLDAVGQAESIIRESGLIGIRRLTTEEILTY